MTHNLDTSAFSRDPEGMLAELLGGTVVRYRDRAVEIGLLSEADVLRNLPGMADAALYRAPAGTLVRYASRDGFRLAIACHPPEGDGVLTLLGLVSDDDRLGPAETYAALGGDLLQGKKIGRESGLWISLPESPNAWARDDRLPTGSPPHRTAYARLLL